MNFLVALGKTLSSFGRVVVKNKPRVFMIGGMTASALGTISACTATYNHIDRIMDKTKKRMEKADKSKNPGKEKFKATMCCVGEIAKTYAVPAALIGIGYAGIGYANHLHEVQEKNLSEALTTVGAAYTALKSRMEEKLGKEAADDIRLGATESVEEVEVEGKNGKKKKEEKVEKTIDQLTGLEASPFAKFFDSSSRCFSDAEDVQARAEYNMEFLKQMEWECDQILKHKGYLFLSEVYEKLDIPITKASLYAGWVYNSKEQISDDFVDFGLYDKNKWATRRFVNGYEDVVLLDFNCAPNISDYI